MSRVDDLEDGVQALEMDLPTRRGLVTHLYDLDSKFRRLDEGQQRLEHRMGGLEDRMGRLEDGQQMLADKIDALVGHFKIQLDD